MYRTRKVKTENISVSSIHYNTAGKHIFMILVIFSSEIICCHWKYIGHSGDKSYYDVAGEMTLPLRQTAALSEDLGSAPNTNMAAHNHL